MTCPNCGRLIPDNSTSCPVCGPIASLKPAAKKDNIVTGIVGALIGAAIGGGVILLLSRLGFIASISGLILAVCTLKGYELLGHKMTGRGLLICLILIAVTPYLADRIDWAIILLEEFPDQGITFADAFAAVPDLVSEDIIPKVDYFKNLGFLYIFALVGAFGTLRDVNLK